MPLICLKPAKFRISTNKSHFISTVVKRHPEEEDVGQKTPLHETVEAPGHALHGLVQLQRVHSAHGKASGSEGGLAEYWREVEEVLNDVAVLVILSAALQPADCLQYDVLALLALLQPPPLDLVQFGVKRVVRIFFGNLNIFFNLKMLVGKPKLFCYLKHTTSVDYQILTILNRRHTMSTRREMFDIKYTHVYEIYKYNLNKTTKF